MNILLDAGSGGRASMRLIHDLFFKYFENDIFWGIFTPIFPKNSLKKIIP